MAHFTKRRLLGKWQDGFCLDQHTLSSVFVGYDEFGHARFDTQRSEMGELLYRLKNKGDMAAVPGIVEAVQALLNDWKPRVDMLVPVPPSTKRDVQPVSVLAAAISREIGIPLADCVRRTRDIPQLKNIFDLDERSKLLEDLHAVDTAVSQGKRILLFDDLYRSGATMNAITSALYDAGRADQVFALTVTRTRSNQ